MQSKVQKAKELESTFNALADKWERETAYYSLIGNMVQHYSYQLILNMGNEAIPLILRRIERNGGLWYHALETITGTKSPAGISELKTERWHAIDITEVNSAWLQWGKEQGYKW